MAAEGILKVHFKSKLDGITIERIARWSELSIHERIALGEVMGGGSMAVNAINNIPGYAPALMEEQRLTLEGRSMDPDYYGSCVRCASAMATTSNQTAGYRETGDDFEVKFNDAMNAETASSIVQLASLLKSAENTNLEKARRENLASVTAVLKSDPKLLKPFAEEEQMAEQTPNEKLRQSRDHVRRLIEAARKAKGT